MLNPQEASVALKGYFKKLVKIINEEASFTFSKTKVINKQRIDDILCCIEGSFPAEYKQYAQRGMGKKLKSYDYYNQLMYAIKNKFFFSTSSYSVRYSEALGLINNITASIDRDINFVYSDQSGMF